MVSQRLREIALANLSPSCDHFWQQTRKAVRPGSPDTNSVLLIEETFLEAPSGVGFREELSGERERKITKYVKTTRLLALKMRNDKLRLLNNLRLDVSHCSICSMPTDSAVANESLLCQVHDNDALSPPHNFSHVQKGQGNQKGN